MSSCLPSSTKRRFCSQQLVTNKRSLFSVQPLHSWKSYILGKWNMINHDEVDYFITFMDWLIMTLESPLGHNKAPRRRTWADAWVLHLWTFPTETPDTWIPGPRLHWRGSRPGQLSIRHLDALSVSWRLFHTGSPCRLQRGTLLNKHHNIRHRMIRYHF